MQHKFLPKCAGILLAFGCMAASAEKSDPALLSTAEAAAIKNVIVFISREQSVASEVRPAGAYGGGIIDLALTDAISQSLVKAARQEFPPEGTPKEVRDFKKINQSMEDGTFLKSINQILTAPFEEKTWFENVEISAQDMEIGRLSLFKFIQKSRMPKDMNAAVLLENQFIFGLDYFKLWFITDVEIYDVRVKLKHAPTAGHREKFVSLYDIRDHFEIPNLESKERKDRLDAENFVRDLWTKDDGKLYFDTVKSLAAENARIMKQYLLKWQPDNAPGKPESSAILAVYKSNFYKPRRTPKLRKTERRQDAYTINDMDPLHRKVYMLRKEYEYTRAVDVMENTPQRLVARDQESSTYYSIPRKNLKLIMESELDPAEYDQFIKSPGKEPSTPVDDPTPNKSAQTIEESADLEE